MAEHSKHPYHSYSTWEWWSDDSENPTEIRLSGDIWEALPVPTARGNARCKEWGSRQEAEEAICALFTEKAVSLKVGEDFSIPITTDLENGCFPAKLSQKEDMKGRK